MIIIIPCFNEVQRIDKQSYINFLKHTLDVNLVFSDDGSTDNTISVLKEIKASYENRVHIYVSIRNHGKAEAIRSAVLYLKTQNLKPSNIAYIDADLAVSLEECYTLSKNLNDKVLLVLGSRISKVDNTIIRSSFRHYSGRMVATVISNILGIAIYDTQCGCKIFKTDLAFKVFEKEFISKWLFDVEIFFRIINLYSKKELKHIAREIPLESWIDTGGSKVKLTYFFRMWFEFYLIKKKYREVN
ncbi:glycosyl transferase family 2 [Salegentibacter sp. 24]|jgi:glycosyltransferase involved in cell wall biosynthesis|uniref:glycosyltransferase n=1 Tax=Salegentibacter sp. 24 TaxID=2183986 RepID=UPI0010E57844|nr:glycosyltransferase [Salegentibacter sp. 24]TDN79503.1 glycosyl transferase family 2 [Salegentibacter sp. 24]|tara:strand:- start:1438 stop:2169 length:732 start_codon:yes stop_codon:yes gene_type:complete